MLRDIDPGLGHHFNGIRIHRVFVYPRRVYVQGITPQVPGPAFSHLAATGIAFVDKENTQGFGAAMLGVFPGAHGC